MMHVAAAALNARVTWMEVTRQAWFAKEDGVATPVVALPVEEMLTLTGMQNDGRKFTGIVATGIGLLALGRLARRRRLGIMNALL